MNLFLRFTGRNVLSLARKSTEYDAEDREMKLLVLQETDWIKRGPHQQHHLMDRMALRDNTERPETIEAGSNILAGADPNRILECTKLMDRNE